MTTNLALQPDVERAILYAVPDSEGIAVSPLHAQHEKETQYQRAIEGISGIEQLIALQERLEQDLPYFQLSTNENIAAYFSRWNVPIGCKSDLTLFSSVLAEKIAEAARSDRTAGTHLANQAYRLQLRELPSALTSLEQTLAGFDALKAPFDAVLRYVWEAVALHGFSMNEDGRKATEPYKAFLIVEPHSQNKKAMHLQITRKCEGMKSDVFEIYVSPKYKTREVVTVKKGWFGRTRKETSTVETEEVDILRIVPIRMFDRKWVANSYNDDGGLQSNAEHFLRTGNEERYYSHIPSANVTTSAGFIDEMRHEVIKNPDSYVPSLQEYLRIILQLPKYLYNYPVRQRQQVSSLLDNVCTEIMNQK